MAEMLAKNEEVLTLANVCIQEVSANRTQADKPHSSKEALVAATAILSRENAEEKHKEEEGGEGSTTTPTTTTTPSHSLSASGETSGAESGGELGAEGFDSHIVRTEKIKKRLTLLLEESKDLEELFREMDEEGGDQKMIAKKDVRELKREMQKELKEKKKVKTTKTKNS